MPDPAGLPYIARDQVLAALTYSAAADALEAALVCGVDPDRDPARYVIDLPKGQLFVMPSVGTGIPVTKVFTVGGEPWVQGVCVVFDPETIAPVALVDAAALTKVRTAALSALAVRKLAPPDAARLVIFGRGLQAHAHADAIAQVRPITSTEFIGSASRPDADELIATADIICCCTNAPEPLFNGRLVADHATVVAMGSHEPHRRELDATLMGRSSVIVESRDPALREAGDVIMAIQAGTLDAAQLITLDALVVHPESVALTGPNVFKSIGMAWEDAVIAAAVLAAHRSPAPDRSDALTEERSAG